MPLPGFTLDRLDQKASNSGSVSIERQLKVRNIVVVEHFACDGAYGTN